MVYSADSPVERQTVSEPSDGTVGVAGYDEWPGAGSRHNSWLPVGVSATV